MPTKIKIVHAHEFISVTPQGQLDFDKSKEMLLQITLAADATHDYDIIIDTRKVHSIMSVTDLWYLSAELSKYNGTFNHKVVILYTSEYFDNAKFFAICSQNRGYKVNAFTSYEDALEWLHLD